MAFDSTSPLLALQSLCMALPGVQSVYVGVPKNFGTAVGVYITVGAQLIEDKANQLLQRRSRYLLTFGYATGGNVQAAELALAASADALILALYPLRDQSGHPLRNCELDLSLNDTAEYQTYTGQEYRRFPVVVTVIQQANY